MPLTNMPTAGQTPVEIAPVDNRPGTSPIGTTSPNSGSVGNTQSTYAPGAYTSGISETAGTSYTVQDTDYQGIVLFNTASAIAVTLNSAVRTNFTCTVLNLGAGAITLTPTLGYLVNGAVSLPMAGHQGATVFFANRAWTAFTGATLIPVVPATFGAISHEWITSYNAGTGGFSASQPDFADVSGNLVTGQLPTVGFTGTAALAKLTTLGTDGSLTITNGLITGVVAPT